ncbi:MAG TPA: hypothetical protein DCM05_18245 [Elusimicrobia bacterium]|nr:hypothetical protein [Elusimicrobiota bacterium]
MDAFKKLFGVEKADIQPDCILTPLDETSLFPGERARGDYFSVTQLPGASVLGTRYSLLAGDCVLHLKDTPCRRLILFNCCGGIGLPIGASLLVRKAYDFEGFSAMLEGRSGAVSCEGDAGLAQRFAGLREGVCATVGSLALEEAHLSRFRELGVDCLDMECSAVFSAARAAGIRAAALFYVSNRVPDKPWHEQLDAPEIAALGQARKGLAAKLLEALAR